MNSTLLISSTLNNFNSTIINNQSWFIPLDIITIVCLTLAIMLTLVFLVIVISDKICHTVSMILVTNSCLAGLFFASVVLWMDIFTLTNDIHQRQYQDSYCVFRGYMSYVACAVLFYSYLLQAIYRYITAVYPSRLFWQSKKVQCFIIILTWIFSFLFAFPHLFTGQIVYHVNNQICQMPLHLSIVAVYNIIYIYLIPMSGIMFIYFKLIQYVKEMTKHVASANTLVRAQRELKMVQRIIILVSILLILGMPYTIFIFMGFFSQPPIYHFRIALTFIDTALLFIIVALFKLTDPIKTSIMKILNRQPNRVVATMT